MRTESSAPTGLNAWAGTLPHPCAQKTPSAVNAEGVPSCNLRGPYGVKNLLGDEGQQSDLTGPLDGLGQLTLMHGAGAGGPAGQDLGPLRNEAAQLGGMISTDALMPIRSRIFIKRWISGY